MRFAPTSAWSTCAARHTRPFACRSGSPYLCLVFSNSRSRCLCPTTYCWLIRVQLLTWATYRWLMTCCFRSFSWCLQPQSQYLTESAQESRRFLSSFSLFHASSCQFECFWLRFLFGGLLFQMQFCCYVPNGFCRERSSKWVFLPLFALRAG